MTGMDELRHFGRVDAAQDRSAFLEFLDRVDALPDVAAYRARTYKPFGSACCVVDVGCGTGTAARELASRVERVVGVDASEMMVEVARERTSDRTDVRFEVGDAISLPLGDRSVDGYRAERLFQHLADPAAAISEARRVLRPGGQICVIDQDWDTLIFATDDIETTRKVTAAMADSVVGGTAARNLAAVFARAGFTEVTVRADATISRDSGSYGVVSALAADMAAASGRVDQQSVELWRADQRARARNDTWLVAFTFLVTTAAAP